MAFDAVSDLDRYCRSTLRRSSRHFERFGPLLDHASKTVTDPTIWEHPWTPPELDLGEAHRHPVFLHRFSDVQRRAWSHLHWVDPSRHRFRPGRLGRPRPRSGPGR